MTSLKKNFSWTLVGNAIYAGCQWGMLVVLAKLGSPQVVGQFALASAIITPVIMITNMQLRGVQATDAKKEYFFSDYMAVRIVSTVVAFFIVLLILCVGHFEKIVFLATLVLASAKSVESLSDVFYGLFQQHEKMSIIAKSMIIKGVLSVVVLGSVFYFSLNLPWSLFGLLCAWMVVLALYDWQMGRRLLETVEGISHCSLVKLSFFSFLDRRTILFRIIVLAFPLGIVMGTISLNTNIPNYAIAKYLGSRDLGIFAALAYTTVAVNMFIQALGQTVTPRLAQYFANKDILAFNALTKKIILINLMIGLLGTLVILIGGEKILTLIYTSEYATYSRLFVVLMISATLSGVASALGYAMTAARQFNLQVPLFLTVLTATFLFAFLLIPSFKLYGAAIALIVSALIQIVGGTFIIRRAFRSN
ncbi:MAG: oligosaccharide flippase family protein [Patescibacteria group bacterium]